ncbi:YjzD family protein [Lactobacillaceae bacterium 24-114]
MFRLRLLSANIGSGIIALILGEILAYIDSQLESVTPDYVLTGILAVIFGLIAANCIYFISRKADPSKD